jgi:hypothetical protein
MSLRESIEWARAQADIWRTKEEPARRYMMGHYTNLANAAEAHFNKTRKAEALRWLDTAMTYAESQQDGGTATPISDQHRATIKELLGEK